MYRHRRYQRTLGVGVNGGVQPRGHHVPEVHALGVDNGLWGRHVLQLRDEQALPTIVANRLRHEGSGVGGPVVGRSIDVKGKLVPTTCIKLRRPTATPSSEIRILP